MLRILQPSPHVAMLNPMGSFWSFSPYPEVSLHQPTGSTLTCISSLTGTNPDGPSTGN